jgi:hypothetical protein
MSLNDIVNVQITKQTASVSRVGFGTPLILTVHDRIPQLAKLYTSLDGMTGDGFTSSDLAYKLAAAILAQNPKVGQFIVGKRSNLPLRTVSMVPVAVNSTEYAFTINGEAFTFTSDASATLAEVIAGLVAAINGGGQDVLATNVGPDTSMKIESADAPGGSATAGAPFTFGVADRSLWTLIHDDTTDAGGTAGIADDIADLRDVNDDWYAICGDWFGEAEIDAVADYIETIPRIQAAMTQDQDVPLSGSSDVASNLLAQDFERTFLYFHPTTEQFPHAASLGKNLPKDPGSITWKFKSLTGVSFQEYTAAELTELRAKNVEHYIRLAGNNISAEGKMIGGEFIDITRFIDWLTARLQENVFRAMISLDKIPFTDQGIGVVENEVRGVLKNGIAVGGLAATPEPTVTVPLASEVDANDKANRLLPDVNFTATLAGAIHATEIRGTVSV